MILDPIYQIPTLVKDRPHQAQITKGIDYSKRLRKHMYGENLKESVKIVAGFEKEYIKDLRKEYCKSNKDLFARLGRPIDKVFTARGGKIYYSLSETLEKRARLLADDVRNGYSVREWVQTFWKPHMLDDPYGIIFMEIQPVQQASLSKQRGKSFVYPTYKPISQVHEYMAKGNRLEYIIFEVSAHEKKMAGIDEKSQIFRVVDDAFDYYVLRDGESVTVLPAFTIPNYFGEVPGMINSDIIDPQSEHSFLSFYDDIIELAEQFWMKGSIKVTHDFLHGFPKYSEFADDCPKCDGTKFVGAEHCTECKGSGKKAMVRPGDVKLMTWPAKNEPMVLPTQVGGYISPDKTYHEISTADIQMLEDVMTITLWGTQSKVKAVGPSNPSTGSGAPQTATEIMEEVKPQADRLHTITKMTEKRHKFILDSIIRVQLNMNYQGSSVNYGKRYMLESPEAIWLKYADARQKGAPQNVLDDLLNEYNETNYQSDPIGLEIATKLMYVEPFVHVDALKLKGLDADPTDYAAKLYFSEWLATITEAAILVLSVEELRGELYKYSGSKKLKEEPKLLPA